MNTHRQLLETILNVAFSRLKCIRADCIERLIGNDEICSSYFDQFVLLDVRVDMMDPAHKYRKSSVVPTSAN
jgi:hypothetical protein